MTPKKLSISFLVLLTLFTSCKKFLDVNHTPNNPISVTPAVQLPNTTIGIAFASANDLDRVTSALVQHIAGTANQTLGYDVFNFSGAFDNSWTGELYDGAISNLLLMIKNDSTSPIYTGVAKLELAYAFSMVIDLWGDAPYSEAGKGLDNLKPRFDKVQDIYQGNSNLGITSLFDLVRAGIADLNKGGGLYKPGVDDIVYGGNVAKWKRMGNTLMLKFAIQLTNVNPALATSVINEVLASADGYINSSSLDFAVPFSSTVGNQNPLYTFNNVNRAGDQMLSLRLLNLSKSLNDTVRLAKFFTKPNGRFTAFDNGSTAAAPTQATRSRYNTYLTGDRAGDAASGKAGGDSSIKLLTWFQVNFILAEAVVRLGVPGDANAWYQQGIRASMQKVGIDTAAISAYFAANPAVVTLSGTPEEQVKQIITQKYIAWIGNGIEAYNDYRRTGYPVLALPLNAGGDNPNVIPARLPYTNQELSRNPNAPNPRPQVDVKLWWAK
jgi:hypothetical protein